MEINVRQIDWSEAWSQAQSRSHKRPFGDPTYWTKRARNFADRQNGKNDYPRKFVDRLELDSGWSVLDVGCGSGTLALPLAERVRHVTALDFSETMLDILGERMTDMGLNNIFRVRAGIDDDWDALGMNPHDLVIASRSMITPDLEGFLAKLTRFARRKVAVSAKVGHGPFDPRITEAAGKTREPGPDYIYVVNQLYRTGIFASVDFIVQNIQRTFAGIDDAVENCRWMFDALTPEEEGRLRDFFKDNLEERDGRWHLTGSEPVRWAVICWDAGG